MTGENGARKPTVGVIARNGLCRGKPRVVKELSRHPRHGKTTVRVFRFGMARRKSPFAGRRVQLVFPHQFIGKREAVAGEFKPRPGGFP